MFAVYWPATTAPSCTCPVQTVCSLGVVRVLAIHRSDYEPIAERFQDSARAVLENVLRFSQQASQGLALNNCLVCPATQATTSVACSFMQYVVLHASLSTICSPKGESCLCGALQMTQDEFPGVYGSDVLNTVLASGAHR